MSEVFEITHSAPIPKIFHSEKEKQLFSKCTICGKTLQDNGELYLIEKAFERNPETGEQKLVFELATCMDCRQEMHESLSEESRQKIEAYFENKCDLEKRDAELKKHNLMEPDIWMHNCIIKNKSFDEVKEFQVYALCWSDELVFHNFPYMICGEVMDEIMDLISEKSLDILNDFMTDLIDLPPEFNELLKNKKLIFI